MHFGTVATLQTEFATLLLPADGITSGADSFVRMSSASANESVVCYRLRTAGERHSIAFAQQKMWMLFPWTSDAEFLYWSLNQDGTNRTLICCNGSYVEAGGRKIISCQRTILRCEVSTVDGKMHVSSSDLGVEVNHEAFGTMSLAEYGV
jgi:hypothetical protein